MFFILEGKYSRKEENDADGKETVARHSNDDLLSKLISFIVKKSIRNFLFSEILLRSLFSSI